jgi:hypothetical protein
MILNHIHSLQNPKRQNLIAKKKPRGIIKKVQHQLQAQLPNALEVLLKLQLPKMHMQTKAPAPIRSPNPIPSPGLQPRN